MRASLVVNARSGRGRAAAIAEEVEAALRHRGVECVRTDIDANDATLHAACRGANALIVVGGDGSVRSMVPFAHKHGAALAIVPMGTENLAAKAFGFTRDAARLASAIVAGRTRRIDIGRVNLAPFLVMASAGFDADLVHRVNAARRGAITRATYVRHALGMVLGWRPTHICVEADGRRVFDGLGQLVVANCRQYAAGLDPARRACPDDGQLDYIVLPARGLAGVARWAIRLAASPDWDGAGTVQGTASRLEVAFGAPCAIQVDGDPLGPLRTAQATFSVDRGALAVVQMPAMG